MPLYHSLPRCIIGSRHVWPAGLPFFILCYLALFSSCHNNRENSPLRNSSGIESEDHVELKDSLAPSQVTIIANLPDSLQPEIIELAGTSEPKTMKVPDEPMSFYLPHKGGQSIVYLNPPKKIKADFSPVLQQYTTEEGLAQDVL